MSLQKLVKRNQTFASLFLFALVRRVILYFFLVLVVVVLWFGVLFLFSFAS